MNYKIPISVLVIIYNNFGNILLLKRADSPKNLDLWQSVTGSKENSDANLIVTACREIYEETKFFAQCILDGKPITYNMPEDSKNTIRIVLAERESADKSGELVCVK